MNVLGLGVTGKSKAEIRVGFRSGWIRSITVALGGAGILGLVFGMFNLAREQPDRVFALLGQWGFLWLIVLALMFLAWDLVKTGMHYLARLADSVQDSAVAMNRIADRDDREQERVTNEIGFVGRRLERLASDLLDYREDQRRHHRELKELLRQRSPGAEQGGDGDGGA